MTRQSIRPGKPLEHAYVASCDGRLRDERLNVHWFLGVADARRQIGAWRFGCGDARPRGGLAGRPLPSEFAALHVLKGNPTRRSA